MDDGSQALDRTVTRSRSRLRYRPVASILGLTGAVLIGIVAWSLRGMILLGAGQMLVSEDALGPVDMIVVSNAASRSGALEAARLYTERISAQLVVPSWVPDRVDDEIRSLGVPLLSSTDLLVSVLKRMGVPP